MRKIRDFKLVLRPKELLRRAKRAQLDLAADGLDSEDLLAAFLENFSRRLHPAVVYESYPASRAPLESPIPGVASSLGVATLGSGEEEPRPAGRLAAEMALDQAVQFVLALLEEEASQEGCLLSPLCRLQEPAALASSLDKLQASKIGVGLSEGRLIPPHTAVFSVSWLTKSRSKSKKN